MALVPFVPSAGLAVGSGLMTAKHQKQVAGALRKVAEVHAQYGVPYQGGGKGALAIGIGAGVPRKKSGRNSVAKSRAPATQLPPVAVGTTITSSTPRSSGRGRSFVISHSALFASLSGAAGFTVAKFRVNPGLPDLFPWLSGISGSFDMYRIVSMEVRYVPITGTDTEGAIYMAWDPDPMDAKPTAKTQVMSYATSLTTPVWKPATLRVPSQGTKYVRRGEVLNVSLNTYDNGQVLVCQQSSAEQVLGDLYVHYTVELMMPHIVANNATLYWSQFIKKAAGTVAESSLHGTLPAASYGDPIVDVSNISYPSSGVVRYPVASLVSYDDGTGGRYYRLLAEVYFEGVAVASTGLTCSDGAAVVSVLRSSVEGTTKATVLYEIKWTTNGPLSGTYLQFDCGGSTSISNYSMSFSSVPDAASGVVD